MIRNPHLAALAAVALLAPSPRPAAACGGFIAHTEGLRFNDALELVVVRDGTRTVMSVRNRYRGPVEEFALLVPVPQVLREGDVQTLDASVFDQLAGLTSPQLFHLEEDDPCRRHDRDDGSKGAGSPGGGNGVKVETEFKVGEYDVVILSATDATGLDGWLRASDYKIPADMAPLLRPYVEASSKFFVAKVDPARVQFVDGVATLSPLRFAYDADEVSLPLRLSTANSPGVQDVLVHAIAKSRLDAVGRPVATIPTGVEMRPGAAGGFPAFYEALFAAVVAKAPGAVVTEYARNANNWQFRDVLPALGAGAPGVPDQNLEAWVVTRLHLRVDRVGNHDDLVLREATPIQGDRFAHTQDATKGAQNDFHAEYVVREPWTGPVKCSRPSWGNWAPSHADEASLALGVRSGGAPLAELIAVDVPSLGVTTAYRLPAHPPEKRGGSNGCGCAGSGAPSSGIALVLVVVLGATRRRSRR